VKIREFQTGDLVLKCVIPITRQKDQGKLRPNWEAPYIIVARGDNGPYTMADQDGKILEAMELFSLEAILCLKSCNINKNIMQLP